MSHLESMVSTHTGPPVHVCLVCAQNDIPLPILHTPESVNEIKSNTVSHSRSVFSDVSSVTYSAFFLQRTPIISPGLLCPWEHPSLVAPTGSGDDEADALPATGPSASILPLSTAALLRVPNYNTEHTNVEALYIHLLCAYKFAKSTLKQTMREMHADITRNWYDLAVLTRDRWQFSQQADLPFHLAALESMSNALDPSVLNPDDKDMDYLLGS
jgi:mediator of RNA polymerase II transcription subunit 13, fungi type